VGRTEEGVAIIGIIEEKEEKKTNAGGGATHFHC